MSQVYRVPGPLESWGSGLDGLPLVQAKVAAGVLEADPSLLDLDTPHQIRERLKSQRAPTLWKPPDRALSLLDATSASEVLEGLPQIRLAIDPGPSHQTSLYEWVQTLNAHPVVSVVVYAAEPHGSPIWQWPLRFGFLDDSESKTLLESLAKNGYWPELQQIVEADQDCDVLVLPGSLSKVEPTLSAKKLGQCGLVVVLGGVDVPVEDVPRAADRIALELAAWGAHLVGASDDPVRWLNHITELLAHNEQIDVALSQAARSIESTGTYTTLTRHGLRKAPLESMISEYADRLNSLGFLEVQVPGELEGMLPGPMPTGRIPARDLSVYLHDAISKGTFFFTGETHEATGFARLVDALGELPEPGPTAAFDIEPGDQGAEDGAEARIINGVVERDGEVYRLDLVADEEYDLEVWIGVVSDESITVPGAPPVPTDDLPPGANRIDVAFTCLDNFEETQRTYVTLPETGDSDRARLSLRFSEPGTVFGRLALLNGGRVIQTAVLRADVVADRPGRLGRPEIVVEDVIRSQLSLPPDEEKFDLAVVINRDTANRRTTSAIKQDGVTIRSAEGLQRGIDKIKDTLTKVADDPDAFAEMTSPKTLQWLFDLAHLGRQLYGTFVEDHQIDPRFFTHGRVQIVSARADAYLPAELIYELEPPTEPPQLCDQWERAVLEGECGSCEALGPNDSRPICLSGFWGVKYVIERHVHDPEYGQMTGEWRLQREPIAGRNQIRAFDSLVWSLSNKILEDDQKRLTSALKPGRFAATNAENWTDVQSKVGSVDPSMLLLLPHTDMQGPLDASELGGELDLVTLIGERMCAPRDKDFVVVLLGCDTAATAIPYQGMVPQFRRAGAAVVITTINAILGRHAAPVASEMLEIFETWAGGPERSMGDALRDLRRQALSDGYPMVLSVVAFGDADWALSA